MSSNDTTTRRIIFYDLPSEHRTVFEGNAPAIKRAQLLRWKSGEELHSLGIECTQSVMVVDPRKLNMSAEIIQRIKDRYILAEQVMQNQFNIPDPKLESTLRLEVITLTGEPATQITAMAEHTINIKIDDTTFRINNTIMRLQGNGDQYTPAQLRRLKYRMPSERIECQEIRDTMASFGMGRANIENLLDMYATVIRILR